MKRPDIKIIREWLDIARKDLERTDSLLEIEDTELAGFCLQQSVEKYLKAYLISNGWKLRRTHDLEALLDEAVVHEGEFAEYRLICQRISQLYIFYRYPNGPNSTIYRDDVVSLKKKVSGLVDKIERELEENNTGG